MNTDQENKNLMLDIIAWESINFPPHRKYYWFLANPSHTNPSYTKIAGVYTFLLDQGSIFDIQSPQIQETYTHGTVPARESKNLMNIYSGTHCCNNFAFSLLLHYCFSFPFCLIPSSI